MVGLVDNYHPAMKSFPGAFQLLFFLGFFLLSVFFNLWLHCFASVSLLSLKPVSSSNRWLIFSKQPPIIPPCTTRPVFDSWEKKKGSPSWWTSWSIWSRAFTFLWVDTKNGWKGTLTLTLTFVRWPWQQMNGVGCVNKQLFADTFIKPLQWGDNKVRERLKLLSSFYHDVVFQFYLVLFFIVKHQSRFLNLSFEMFLLLLFSVGTFCSL